MQVRNGWRIGLFTLLAVTVAPATLVSSPALARSTRSMSSQMRMGPIVSTRHNAFWGYYDGHKDLYVNTDVSNKRQAAEMHVNFAAALSKVPMGSAPGIYLVNGRAAANQLAVFGSEPGKSDYSPIWHEVFVSWKASARSVLLTSDNQILKLKSQGKLTLRVNAVMLNCPILKVGK